MSFDTVTVANASAIAASPGSSGVTAQTLSFVNAGTTSTVSIAADASAATIADGINAEVSGVRATATTGAKLTVTGFDFEANEALTLKINGESLTIDVNAAASANGLSAAITAAVQNNAALAGVAVTDKTGGVVELRDATGADISVELVSFVAGASAATEQVTVRALDADDSVSGTDRDLDAAGETTIVTGDITFSVTDANADYDIFSTDGSGNITSATSSGTSVDTVSVSTSRVSDLDISTASGANDALEIVDAALTQLDSSALTWCCTKPV